MVATATVFVQRSLTQQESDDAITEQNQDEGAEHFANKLFHSTIFHEYFSF